MSDETPTLTGLLALDRRMRGVGPLPGDDAAVRALVARVSDRAAMQRAAQGRFLPDDPELYRDLAGDVLVRLVTSPRTVLDPIAEKFGVDRVDALPDERLGAAERVATTYLAVMLHHRAIDRHRRRGARLADPMRTEDPGEALAALPDPSATDEGRVAAEAREFASRCREALDDVAREVATTRALKDFATSYAQLWALADGATTLDALARESGLAEPALHQRHKRARTALEDALETRARAGALEPDLADALARVVAQHLKRRQTRGPARVLPPEAPRMERPDVR